MAVPEPDFGTILQDLLDDPEDGFAVNDPLFSQLIKNKGLKQLEGPYGEFAVEYQGPGTATQLNSGYEPYGYPSSPVLVVGNVRPARHIYTYSISKKDLDRAGGTGDKWDIVKTKSLAAMSDIRQQIGYQTASGTKADGSTATLFPGLFTLNKNKTYAVEGTTYTGWLDPVAKASQTTTRLGISSTTYNDVWYNQYGTVASAFSTDGVTKLQQTINACNRQGVDSNEFADLGFADSVSFAKLLEEIRTDHRITLPGPNALAQGTGSLLNTRDAVLMGKVRIFDEPHIVLGAFGGTAATGVIYILTSKQIGLIAPKKVTQLLKVQSKDQIPGQDVIGHEVLLDFNAYTKSLRQHGIVTNTNA